jgi:hypothetical protein
MGSVYWASVCSSAESEEKQGNTLATLYATHAFACCCFVAASVFSGLWLCRWLHAKRLQPQLLQSVWRFMGRFLAFTFTCCIFGIAGWICKVAQVSNSRELAILEDTPEDSCQLLVLSIRANQFQSAYRILHSVESFCLLFSIIIGLDRIIEHASRTDNMSQRKPSQLLMEFTVSNPHASGKARSREGRLSQKPLAFSRKSALKFVFKSGIIILVMFSFASFISVVAAAAIQKNLAYNMQQSIELCKSNISSTFESILSENEEYNNNLVELMRSIFAGHVAQCAGATMAILLYVAVGSLGYSIVRSARKKIETSRVRLQQLRANMDTRQDSTAAADAGAVRSILFVYTRM